ncbi:MAG: type II toxin-antitoxin system VapC family toxin [Gammaproteobacteria bacterium]|nr:type II toxin-antitoxin system VapC family toxin [Gammaproteobacteria bacterium]
MIVFDTCAIIYDALEPKRLSPAARRAIAQGEQQKQLVCSDISLWEIAMLISKKRLDPGTDYLSFIKTVLAARAIQVKEIAPEIADLAVSFSSSLNNDPADRIIVATAIHLNAALVTCDNNLTGAGLVKTIW